MSHHRPFSLCKVIYWYICHIPFSCYPFLFYKKSFLTALFRTMVAFKGLDTIQKLSTDDFRCLKDNGFTFYIGRVWKSTGNYDIEGMQTMKNAHEAGFKVSAYIFPGLEPHNAPPQNQVEATINRLRAEGVPFDTVYLDIEIFRWPKKNFCRAPPEPKSWVRHCINAMGNKLDEMGVDWGIYTNENNWENIVGLEYDQWKHKKLWWAHWGMNDGTRKGAFTPFGGWSNFYIHQYAGDINGPCGVKEIDLNYSELV
ncbi:unnamed protein product [Cylicocyclus nassatus]|uniref:Glycosyl hydrolase family 25 n=1 Tax=Cylicocyclus nassatus TaxID=53992 RepID=A0AA36HDT9_CYLNA|nr:unnamed protein product [Cylicocyclus nassatus]